MSKEKKPKKEWKDLSKKEKVIGIAGTIFIVIAIIAGMSGAFNNKEALPVSTNDTKEVDKVKEAKKEKAKEDKPKEKVYSLGFDAEGFKKRFNDVSKEYGSPFHIDSIEVKDGEIQDVATIMLNDLIAINLNINKKDGSIRDLTLIGQGDGTEGSGMDIMLGIGSIVSTLNPELDQDGRANVLKGLGLDKGMPEDATEYTEGNIKYSFVYVEGAGVTFSASNKNDNGGTH
ncbi:hypothetical protein [Siminovitchia fortis]|uniref:hypothetical protein n=1 Tax=Siminovitchia fortis TaxID=254758 RepID=UPI0011A74CCC|nr:hypothetical protein [Siminovitchia fortis]